MSAQIITHADFTNMRIRRETSQPLKDRPAGVLYRHPEAVFVPGDWVKIPSGLIAMIAQFEMSEGRLCARLLACGGLRPLVPVKDLVRTPCPGGAA